MDNQTKIDSFAAFYVWRRGGDRSDSVYVDSNYLPFNQCLCPLLATSRDYSNVFPLPEGLAPEDVASFKLYDGKGSYTNYWITREAYRLIYEYKQFQGMSFLRQVVPIQHARKLWHHFLHQSETDPTMVAYTPNHQYGLRDRQVIMKVGKYLKRFYGDVLSDEQIRDLSNNSSDVPVHWAHTEEDIKFVYDNGPHSCMKGNEAIKVYSYKYPESEGGDYEFGVAYTKIGDTVLSRALCSMRHKVFTRHYGDSGMILQSRLESMGYTKVSGMDEYNLRLGYFKVNHRNYDIWLMPYLDGHGKYVYGPRTDTDNIGYWNWGNQNQLPYDMELEAENANGEISESDGEQSDCACCGEQFHNDDLNYSEYHDNPYCSHCTEEYYVYATFDTRGNACLVECEQVIYCESDGNYYIDQSRVLSAYDIVSCGDSYYKLEDTVTMLDGDQMPSDSSRIIMCGEDDCQGDVYEYRREIFRDWVSPDMKTWYHPDYIPEHVAEDEDIELHDIDYWLECGYVDKIIDLTGYRHKVLAWHEAILAAKSAPLFVEETS